MTSVIVHEERELPGMQKAMKAKNASYLKRQWVCIHFTAKHARDG